MQGIARRVSTSMKQGVDKIAEHSAKLAAEEKEKQRGKRVQRLRGRFSSAMDTLKQVRWSIIIIVISVA